MPVLISGILKDGMGNPIPNCTIELKASHTSTTVITKTVASEQIDQNGSYSMNVELGKYRVTLCIDGYPPQVVGDIYVHAESVPGTLNYFLGLPTEGDLPPAAIQQFEEMVALVSKQAAQVEKDKAAAAQSAADALASQNAAKTSETAANGSKVAAAQSAADALASKNAAKTSEANAGKSADGAAASAQAAKISETNAANSKSGAETSAASALASKNDAKTSETNAAASKSAAAQSAATAKTEADKAAGALASKQDKNALLTAIAALNTAADQIITMTGKDSVAVAALSNFAKGLLAKTDADGIREYLGLKETINKAASALQDGSWGLGNVNYGNLPMGVASQFLIYASSAPEVPANCAGFQAVYAKTRRAQIVINTMGEVFSRFSMSDDVLDKTTPWAMHFTTLKPPTARDTGAIPYFGQIPAGTNLNTLTNHGVWFNSANANATPELNYPSWQAGSLQVLRDAGATQVYTEYSSGGAGRQWRRGLYMGTWSGWRVVYDSGNTTIDTNGFIKRASPIVKLFSDGSSELNSESEGVTVSRENVGVYRISGVLGMNSDGAWGGIDGGFDVPKDRNGQCLVWLDYEVDADGSILVKTYHRTYPDSPEFARNVKDGYAAGDPIDIPIDQYLSVRVQMPQDSIFNRRQLEMEQAVAGQSIDHVES